MAKNLAQNAGKEAIEKLGWCARIGFWFYVGYVSSPSLRCLWLGRH